jgi:hypothetical protein
MRKMLANTLVSGLLLATFPGAALAGDTHAVSNRWAGVAIGAAAAVVGGVLLNALQTPAVTPPTTYAPPPVVYAPAPRIVYTTPPPYAPAPRIVYTTPPPVAYAPPTVAYSAPPVIYSRPAPVVVHREWGTTSRWNRWHPENGRGWDRD